MSRVSTYLNFAGSTLAAFEFYRDVFGTEFDGPVMKMRDVPSGPDEQGFAEDELDLVMHIDQSIRAVRVGGV